MERLSESRLQRLTASFNGQTMMATLGIQLRHAAPGKVRFEMPFDPAFSQQHGFLHAGALTTAMDSACGYAAFSLMPDDAEVLTVELKVSLLAPARAARFVIEGSVIKPGRTLYFTEGAAFADEDGSLTRVATITATMMAVRGRADVQPAAASK